MLGVMIEATSQEDFHFGHADGVSLLEFSLNDDVSKRFVSRRESH